MATTSVDPAALQAAARRIDAAADILAEAVRAPLARLQFGSAAAGRAHGPAGAEVRRGLERLCAAADQWAHAARELAAALNTGADRYRAAEHRAAAALR